ncbi:hypothetical protein ES703_118404 [subsurface metagenome]
MMNDYRYTSVSTYQFFVALALLIGQEGTHWIHCLADPGEYTDPFFGHQN